MNLSLFLGRDLTVPAIGITTGLATVLGGTVVLRVKTWLDGLVAFGAGVVLGVSLFDLLPESLKLGGPASGTLGIPAALAGGFVAYLWLTRTVHALAPEGAWRGHFGAAALTLHSFTDGLGIGLAFHVSPAAGLIVAAAVIAHDLVDGANTVTLALLGGVSRPAASGWLAADALAPLAGIELARQIAMPQTALAVLLAIFAGFFLYIGTSELLPQALHRGPRASTPLMFAVGLVLLYAIVRLSGG